MQRLSVILLVLSQALTQVSAHESPEHSVKELTAHIENQRTPDNLYQRAIAYRALGQLDKSITDFKAAISLAPDNLTFQLDLSRTLLSRSLPDKALNAANRALKLSKTPAQRATCHILRSQAYHNNQRYKPSLQACQLAFREVPRGEIEWFLLRSENQRQLGQLQPRINDLKAGLKLHHSAVIKAHWIDAIIDAGQFRTALPHIQSELADRRWKSSWLIKRARTLQGLNRGSEATANLHSALAEIQSRLNPQRPDPLLLADRGVAYALLGNKQEATNCLEKLRQLRAAPWITSQLETLLAKLQVPKVEPAK